MQKLLTGNDSSSSITLIFYRKGFFLMQKTKKSSFFNWLLPFIGPVLLIAIGILLLVNSDLLNKICIVCGSILALLGFTEIVIYSATVKYEKRPRILGTGVILLVLAAIFILIPITFDLLIPFFIGAFVLLSGIGGFVETVRITQRIPAGFWHSYLTLQLLYWVLSFCSTSGAVSSIS